MRCDTPVGRGHVLGLVKQLSSGLLKNLFLRNIIGHFTCVHSFMHTDNILKDEAHVRVFDFMARNVRHL